MTALLKQTPGGVNPALADTLDSVKRSVVRTLDALGDVVSDLAEFVEDDAASEDQREAAKILIGETENTALWIHRRLAELCEACGEDNDID
jgi:hypothetical protein